MSGHSDSIREKRAQETRKNGGRKAKPKGLAYLVATQFNDSTEQLAVLEKLCYGRLDIDYLTWNGRC